MFEVCGVRASISNQRNRHKYRYPGPSEKRKKLDTHNEMWISIRCICIYLSQAKRTSVKLASVTTRSIESLALIVPANMATATEDEGEKKNRSLAPNPFAAQRFLCWHFQFGAVEMGGGVVIDAVRRLITIKQSVQLMS